MNYMKIKSIALSMLVIGSCKAAGMYGYREPSQVVGEQQSVVVADQALTRAISRAWAQEHGSEYCPEAVGVSAPVQPSTVAVAQVSSKEQTSLMDAVKWVWNFGGTTPKQSTVDMAAREKEFNQAPKAASPNRLMQWWDGFWNGSKPSESASQPARIESPAKVDSRLYAGSNVSEASDYVDMTEFGSIDYPGAPVNKSQRAANKSGISAPKPGSAHIEQPTGISAGVVATLRNHPKKALAAGIIAASGAAYYAYKNYRKAPVVRRALSKPIDALAATFVAVENPVQVTAPVQSQPQVARRVQHAAVRKGSQRATRGRTAARMMAARRVVQQRGRRVRKAQIQKRGQSRRNMRGVRMQRRRR